MENKKWGDPNGAERQNQKFRERICIKLERRVENGEWENKTRKEKPTGLNYPSQKDCC